MNQTIPNRIVIGVLDGVMNFLDVQIMEKRRAGKHFEASSLLDEKIAVREAREFIAENRKVYD